MRKQLAAYTDSVAQINFGVSDINLILAIDSSGFVYRPSNEKITLKINIPISALIQNRSKQNLAITIDGDAAFASAILQIFSNLTIDPKEDLSRIIGAIPAHILFGFSAYVSANIKSYVLNFIDNISDYLIYEAQIVLEKHAQQNFAKQVTALEIDIFRLESRVSNAFIA